MAGAFGIFRRPSAALLASPAALAVLASLGAAAQPPSVVGSAARSAAYTIECPADEPAPVACAADLTTYIGWRVFERYCADCHGVDAEGSTFAPSLVQRVQRLDRRAFERALDEGYAGPDAPIRPWAEHPQVVRYYGELWAYLSARANRDVPPVPLRPIREPPE